jgi:hypothetical protein
LFFVFVFVFAHLLTYPTHPSICPSSYPFFALIALTWRRCYLRKKSCYLEEEEEVLLLGEGGRNHEEEEEEDAPILHN